MPTINPQAIPRPEHPRPDFMRPTFHNLNGAWAFAFDDKNVGLAQRWQKSGTPLPLSIQVPFCYQSAASGIHLDEIHPVMWYRRAFTVPDAMAGQRVLLRFGAVDYACRVYVNGEMVGTHEGGYTPFSFDITPALQPGENDVCLRVEDAPDCTQPRGKQYWRTGLMGCWYTPTSGIWQTVYLEAVGACALQTVHITPDIDSLVAHVALTLEAMPQRPLRVEVEVSCEGAPVRTVCSDMVDRQLSLPIHMIAQGDLNPVRLWSPQHPALYDVKVRVLEDARVLDEVTTYFGMRKVEVRDGRVLLNNHPFYQRLILDQGYWPESLMTPPSDEAIRADLQWTRDFGYNGARKHQKVEDPRYYYWADKMGLLVWGEVPSMYAFTQASVAHLADTLQGFIARDYNHPCIIAWVPLNESWGVPQIFNHAQQQATGRMLYHLAKASDGTRLVSGNDGWEQTTTDICALHDYAAQGEVIAAHFATREQVERLGNDSHLCYAVGEVPTGKEAFLVTEYGGIAYSSRGAQEDMGGMSTWGYHGKEPDEASFLARFSSVTDAIRDLPYCEGYCYTQLTDVMQEINGLLSPDRKPKVDVAAFKARNRSPKGHPSQA